MLSDDRGAVSCRLGDAITLKRGYDLPERMRRPGRVPIYSSSGPTGFHDQAMAKAPGVVTGRYGTLGEVFFVREDFWPLNTSLYVADFKGNDARFFSYLLRTLDFAILNDKSGVPGLNRNDLHEIEIEVPSPRRQQAIASLLGALDDKIDLNDRINRTLEELARAMFKSWFVDFDPVVARRDGKAPVGVPTDAVELFPSHFEDSELGPIPKGWHVAPLDSVASFLNGLALQNYPPRGLDDLPVIKIAELRAGTADGADGCGGIPAEYVIDDGDVVFSWSGSLMVDVWCGGRGALNQHLFKVSSEQVPKWYYLGWVNEHLPEFQAIAADKATTMGHIRRFHLSDAKVVVPDDRLWVVMNAVQQPMLDQIIHNRIESRTLARLRDTLLGPLLSGEITIKTAEKAVAEAD